MTPSALLGGLLGVTLLLVGILAWRPSLTRGTGGKILAFVALFLAPSLAILAGGMDHMEASKSTTFCLSCHPMVAYGRSLHVDDNEFIPAVHFQNNYVPRDKACYTCHTDYVLYGTLKAKIRGLRHIAVQYLGTVPDTIRLYTPYNNRECLHCHAGSRKFLNADGHKGEATFAADVASGKLSCLASGCHDVAHNVRELADATFWKEGQP